MSTILDIARDVCGPLSLQQPVTLFADYDEGDTTGIRLLRAISQTCGYLVASFDWSVLKARHSFTTTATQAQATGLPSDFLRMIIGTAWNDTLRRQLCGPLSDEEWAGTLSSPVARIEPAWSLDGGVFSMAPPPNAGETVSFSYIRNAIGRNAATARISRFTDDADSALWDDELVTLGAVYHFRKMERFDYAQDEIDFKLCMQDRIKRDGGGKVLRMGGGSDSASDMVAKMKSGALFITP